jgi:hypothetical protein
MTFQLFPDPMIVQPIIQRQNRLEARRTTRHRAPRKRLRPSDRRNILIAGLITAVLFPLVHHSGGQAKEAGMISEPQSGHQAGALAKTASAVQANAFHGSFPASITRWQGEVDHALAAKHRVRHKLVPMTAVKFRTDSQAAWHYMNILALPGQRSIIYNLMRLSGGNPDFSSGDRTGLLPMSLSQRIYAAKEMNLHYVTSGPTWPYKSLLLGIRTANDDLFNLVVMHRSTYQHDMCILHDNGRGLILDFLNKWDPGMPVGQMKQFVNWYVQWGPKGLDAVSLKQFCVGAK